MGVCAGQESWAEWAGHAGCCWAEKRETGAHLGKVHNPRLLERIVTSPSTGSRPSATSYQPLDTFQLPPVTAQDGLLSEMLLLREPTHWGAHDGRDDSCPQCLLHRPHGNLTEQEDAPGPGGHPHTQRVRQRRKPGPARVEHVGDGAGPAPECGHL